MNKKIFTGIAALFVVALLIKTYILTNHKLDLEETVVELEEKIDEQQIDKANLHYQINQLEEEKNKLEEDKKSLEEEVKKHKQVSRGGSRKPHTYNESHSLGSFEATAYIDDAASQGKWVGTTATGFSLKGKSRTDAMCIAVDPKVIPLNSKVKLTFDGDMQQYNGIYTAYDTGGAIKGRIIDIFMGQSNSRDEMKNFGRRKVTVEIVK